MYSTWMSLVNSPTHSTITGPLLLFTSSTFTPATPPPTHVQHMQVYSKQFHVPHTTFHYWSFTSVHHLHIDSPHPTHIYSTSKFVVKSHTHTTLLYLYPPVPHWGAPRQTGAGCVALSRRRMPPWGAPSALPLPSSTPYTSPPGLWPVPWKWK